MFLALVSVITLFCNTVVIENPKLNQQDSNAEKKKKKKTPEDGIEVQCAHLHLRAMPR